MVNNANIYAHTWRAHTHTHSRTNTHRGSSGSSINGSSSSRSISLVCVCVCASATRAKTLCQSTARSPFVCLRVVYDTKYELKLNIVVGNVGGTLCCTRHKPTQPPAHTRERIAPHSNEPDCLAHISPTTTPTTTHNTTQHAMCALNG